MERLPGFRDFYPEPLPNADAWSADARQWIFSKWRETARRYGFREYDGPPLEPLELFTVKSGEEIVGQLYNFKDKGNREIALRPEMTPSLARMIAAHERNYKKPIKWFAIPQLFRYERQQKGRLREHFQFNSDIFGEENEATDSELIALLIDSLRNLGLTSEDFVIRLSSRIAWQKFFESKSGDPARAYDFFQIIDKLEREVPEQARAKLREVGFDYDEIMQFIQAGEPTPELGRILENLEARGLRDFIKIDYHVIRGLAYYTGVVFEAFDKKGEFRAIAGGGRYNNLVKLISAGKVDLPAIGFGMGDVVLLELLKSRKLLPSNLHAPDAYWVIAAEEDRNGALAGIQQLRNAGFSVDYSFTPLARDKQVKRAIELKCRFVISKSAADSSLLARNLGTREEASVTMDQAIELLLLKTVAADVNPL